MCSNVDFSKYFAKPAKFKKPPLKKFITSADVLANVVQMPKRSESLKRSKSGLDDFWRCATNDPKLDEKTLLNLRKYTPIKLLGEGRSSQVYCVSLNTNGENFALKVLKKAEIISKNQLKNVINEKELLFQIDCPYIIKLYNTFVDSRHVYLLEEFCDNGELFGLLRKLGAFEKELVKFYAAEIICALEYLHKRKICYRDLKPENILLDKNGHIKLCDLGISKKVEDKAWTICGTAEYIAPEVILGLGHHHAADWWSFGILLYEMIAGYPPFFASNEFELYKKILDLNYDFTSPSFDEVSKDLITSFLRPPNKRLGNLNGGVEDIKQHKFFEGADWGNFEKKNIPSPYIPYVCCPQREDIDNLYANGNEEDPYEPMFRDFDFQCSP